MYTSQASPPILCLYTDGGSDHRCTYGSIQIALISLFLSGNYDMLIAVRTAPHHSWTNPAERIMSILNLGLQNVAIMRNTMSDESKVLFDKADTLDEIRDKANKNSNLEMELRDCIKDFMSKVDPLLTCNDTTQAQLTRHNELVSFMKTHCHERVYSFQIKKCQDVSCNICIPIRLPQTVFDSLHFLPDPVPALDNPDHYTSFQAVYGKQTSEEFHPSLQLKVRLRLGRDSDFVDSPDSIRTKYKIIYPLCQRCQDKGKEFNVRMEVKVNGSNSKRRKTR
ncbi:hypothetical protein RhiirA4_448376 [Rhizophagus irregularis]|uniref:Uncharacterized protein n=1 Tax=Rhizophagus irregularis TaxID=588596 RepID=A0A2I1H968_9GLOM|nr:hypothetical protein RhiirA4_448376 [Rhizophagus irregularis]